MEECLVASVAGSFVSWARLMDAVKTDNELQKVLEQVKRGSDERTEWLGVSGWFQYRGSLVFYQQPLLYKHRIVIPVSLREEVYCLQGFMGPCSLCCGQA